MGREHIDVRQISIELIWSIILICVNLIECTISTENAFSQIKKIYSCSKKTVPSIYLLAPIPYLLLPFVPNIDLNQVKFTWFKNIWFLCSFSVRKMFSFNDKNNQLFNRNAEIRINIYITSPELRCIERIIKIGYSRTCKLIYHSL